MARAMALLVNSVISGATWLGGVNGVWTCAATDFIHRAFERRMARQRVIERAAKAVHVRMEILAFALDFFRGDVINRAPNVFLPSVVRLGGAHQAEINQASVRPRHCKVYCQA